VQYFRIVVFTVRVVQGYMCSTKLSFFILIMLWILFYENLQPKYKSYIHPSPTPNLVVD